MMACGLLRPRTGGYEPLNLTTGSAFVWLSHKYDPESYNVNTTTNQDVLVSTIFINGIYTKLDYRSSVVPICKTSIYLYKQSMEK